MGLVRRSLNITTKRIKLTIVIHILFLFRTAYSSDCLDGTSNQDTGTFLIKSFTSAIDNATCTLIEKTKYADSNVNNNTEYDFIIIGAGSAGSVLANRLTENSNWRVLLLEAGGDPTVTSEIPALLGNTQGTSLDWQYRTEPEPTNCLGSVNRSCLWPRGKVLGGSSTINAMLYVRGDPDNFDGWERMGNKGWGYKSMLKYFKKSEDMRSEEVSANDDFWVYHNKSGLLKIESFKNNIDIFKQTFSKAYEEIGYQTFNDVNAKHHKGFFTLQGTLENARRCSASKAFLFNFQNRKNLVISKNSLAIKILINNNNVSYGVQFKKAGKLINVRAIKEVIVSCGSINSPQLLMLSGIGPQKHLEHYNITVVRDLAVGNNLQDHPLMRGFIITLNISGSSPTPQTDMCQYLLNSSGNYAGISTFSLCGFISTSKAKLSPNIQFYYTIFPANSSTLKSALTTIGFNDNIQRSILNINSKRFTLFMLPCLIQPKSRGKILLKNTNPEVHPSIFPGYFSEEEDMKEMLEAISFANKFVNTDAMKMLDAKVEKIIIPECEGFQFQTEEYWRCLIMHMSVTVYHPVGTCAMGPCEKNAVVDSELRVHGMKGLRVIDASIMPNITSGNTNAPTIAIAEKGAELVKNDWQNLNA